MASNKGHVAVGAIAVGYIKGIIANYPSSNYEANYS
jgi:hypothetical protein